jgi:hypothetical protein
VPIVLVVTALAMVGLPALASVGPRVTRSSSSSGFEFGLIGGPHATGEGRAGLPQLVQDVAAAEVAFTVHHGGIGAGPAGCSDDQYLETRDLFDASAAPVIYTPSEDDWANCRSGGPGASERLGALRRILFPTDRSRGQRSMPLEGQRPEYPENSRWRYGPVTFATLHVIGARDGQGRDPAGDAESSARRAATLAWLNQTFDLAAGEDSAGVVLIWHANPRFRQDAPAYNDLRGALRARTIAFGKPVVLVHADGDGFGVDQPMFDDRGRPVENFTRVKTSGSADGQWVRATVNPANPELFTFRLQHVGLPEGPVRAEPLRCLAARDEALAIHALPSGTGEASGLVASTRYPGWGWMIRDSGHSASVYAIRFPGGDAPRQVRKIRVLGAKNIDWEDIAYQDGKLYVIESDQTRRARFIYEIPEPDPLGPLRVRMSARHRYAYPGGRRYNTEAAFFFAGRLVLVPKTSPALLYRFDQPLSPDRVNRPHLVTSLPGSKKVSVARVAPDRHVLILVSHEKIFVYETPRPATTLRQFAARPVRRQRINNGDNVEGGDFFLLGACKLVLVAESKQIYRIPPVRPPHIPSPLP